MVFNRLNCAYQKKFADFSKKEFFLGTLFCSISVYFGIRGNSILSELEAPLYNYLILK